MNERLHILGVRHHGPGSAASVLDALAALDPCTVLIEGPADAADILHHATASGMRPPVAILIHGVDDPSQSVFYPFAEHSPEWQALRWALERKREVRFIDLPAGISLAKPDGAESQIDQSPEKPAPIVYDPLGTLAAAAGESDGETWWNALVEQNTHSRTVFPAIAEAMTAVRTACEADGQDRDREREERREAHMRLAIREALQSTDGNVVVVCGAWHVPALQSDVAVKDDRAVLKGLPRCKTSSTWVPWTDTRLAAASGYGAGVISPGWYRHLWRMRREGGSHTEMIAARWQARVAELLRGEGLLASTASVIEAARLAISLSAVRGFGTPGLAEMRDASLAVLCQGETTLLRLIENRLVIGREIGEIDETVPRMPLALDLERWQKRLRLKPSADPEQIALDLRSETGLAKSTLLHRLLLIAVPWGRKAAAAGRGTFRETWTLVWEPELSVKLAEALRWGATIEQAAAGAARETADNASGVAALAQLVEDCLLADLAEAAAFATGRLQSLAVNSSDVTGLMLAVAPLVNVLRYGTARKVPVDELNLLVAAMATEVCIGLVHASRGLDDEATDAMAKAMRAFDHAMAILENEDRSAAWRDALTKLLHDDQVAPLLKGFAARKLQDQNAMAGDEIAATLSRALSPSVPPSDCAAWLEGFLSDAAQLLLHDHNLFDLIDGWMMGLDGEAFTNLVPALRRSLSNLDAMERRRLVEQIGSGAGPARAQRGEVADPRADAAFAAALPLLKTILGLDNDGE